MRRGAPAAGPLTQVVAGAFLTALLVGPAAAIAWGCRGESGPEPLEARAQQYLALKQKHDWTAIYDGFLDPESRKAIPKDKFLRKRNLAFDVLAFELVSATADGERGTVRAKLDAMIPVLDPRGGTVMTRKQVDDPQKWVNRDGRWYIHLEG